MINKSIYLSIFLFLCFVTNFRTLILEPLILLCITISSKRLLNLGKLINYFSSPLFRSFFFFSYRRRNCFREASRCRARGGADVHINLRHSAPIMLTQSTTGMIRKVAVTFPAYHSPRALFRFIVEPTSAFEDPEFYIVPLAVASFSSRQRHSKKRVNSREFWRKTTTTIRICVYS